MTESCRSQAAAETLPDFGQRLAQVGFAGQASRNVAAGNQEVDFLQKRFNPRVQVIQIGDHGDAGFARPVCGGDCRSRIVTVDVEGAGVDDPFALEFFRLQGQSVVTLPENRALARIVDEDDCLLAGASRGGDEMGLDTQSIELSTMNGSGAVAADLAHVARAHPPLLAGGNRGCDLSAREDVGGTKFYFGSQGGIVRKTDQHVGSIQSDADQIKLGQGVHDGFS